MGASGPKSSTFFKREKHFVNSLLSSYVISPLATQIGAIVYGRNARVAFALNRHGSQSSLRTAIDKMRHPGDGGNIGEALQLARISLFSQENGARYNMQKSLVIFLNEKTMGDEKELRTELQALKSSGVRFVVIGLDGNVDRRITSEIASRNAMFFPPGLEQLEAYLYPVYRATFEGGIFMGYFALLPQFLK